MPPHGYDFRNPVSESARLVLPMVDPCQLCIVFATHLHDAVNLSMHTKQTAGRRLAGNFP
jgi:hypothetical protein